MSALMNIDGISRTFGTHPPVKVLDGLTFAVDRGQCVGLVGESGSGKSTTIRCLMRLVKPSNGTIRFDGEDVWAMGPKAVRQFRREVQIIFQDPASSLNPRMSIREIVEEGLIVHRLEPVAAARRQLVIDTLASVGLDQDILDRRPTSFSGGQQQRIAIARALVVSPRMLVCDEPVSALDVSVQAQVVNLLQDLQRERDLAIIFVAHDLAVVRHLCDQVNILEKGRIVEHGSREKIFETPAHPYTRALLDAVPVPDPTIQRSRRHLTA